MHKDGLKQKLDIWILPDSPYISTIMRNSFVFYGSWWEAIKNLPRDVQGDVLTAIIEYGLSGETTEQLKPITKAMLAMVKPQIDANNQRYENGKKGGRKKHGDNQTEAKQEPKQNQTETKQEPKQNQTETKQEPKQNQTETKQEPKQNQTETLNDNVNDNVNDNKKESSNEDKKDPPPKTQYEKFNDWMKDNTPNVCKLKNQVTEEQYHKIRERYSYQQLVDILLAMENYKELTKKYTSVYLTFLKWAKKEYGTD